MATANANVKKVLNRLNQKISSVGGVIDSWSDGNGNWWRKYADGWIEQGGVLAASTQHHSDREITFPLSFSSTSYVLLIEASWNANDGLGSMVKAKAMSSATAVFVTYYDKCAGWYACGY